MALILKDRVLETTHTGGTGTVTLLGAQPNFLTFSSAIGNGNTTYYTIVDDGDNQWEVGIGTVGAGTLTRDTVLSSSNSGNLVNFGVADKQVFCDYPASKSVYQDSNGLVTVPNLATNSASSLTPVLTYNASNSAQTNGATVAGSYLQNVMQNKSGTAGASTNFAVSNDLGTDSTYYGEFGMNSSVFSSGTPADYFSINNGVYYSGHDGDISIGSGNGYKTYLAWGTAGQSAHVINATGAIGLNTNITGTTNFGTSGQPLISGGSSATPTWGTLGIIGGGTNSTATPTAGAVPYGTGTAYAFTSAGTTGQVLVSNGASPPTWATNSPTGSLVQSDIGTAPNQIPLNQYLGNMAYEDKAGVVLTGDAKVNGITAGLGAGQVSTNTVYGNAALGSNVTGASNVAVGQQALRVNTASNNTAVGYQAGYSNTTGAANLFDGFQSGYSNTTGGYNTYLGYATGVYASGSRNTFVGNSSNNVGVSTSSDNTALGYATLSALTSGGNNVAIGASALQNNTTANNNTAVGYQAGYSNLTGTNNTFNGYQAGYTNSTGAYNTAFGHACLYTNNGSYNNAIGWQSLYSNTTGSYIQSIGHNALFANTTGSNNIAIGEQALTSNTTASNNTAVGYQAGYNNTVGTQNVYLGYRSGYTNTNTNSVTAIGYESGKFLNNNNNNTAGETFVGALAGQSATTAIDSTFVGANAGQSTTTGNNNTALGASAFKANTTGSNNLALGYQALQANTTASYNATIGTQSGYNNTTGGGNFYAGYQAGYTNSTGSNNVAIGNSAAYSSTGSGNTIVGAYNTTASGGSGSAMTTGNQNTILGGFTGNQSGLDIRTASNYVVLSDGAGLPIIASAASKTVALQGALPNAGTGITFPATQSASTDANTLDDYEEGTWTVSDSSGAGLTFTNTSGIYTKVGRLVICNVIFQYPVTVDGSQAKISLPFTASNVTNAGGGVFYSNTPGIAGAQPTVVGNYAYFLLSNVAAGTAYLNSVASGTYFRGTISYFV